MSQHPLLIKRESFYTRFVETVVKMPKSKGFPSGVYQTDINSFFAKLGYAEAVVIPFERRTDGLFVTDYVDACTKEFYRRIGFASATPLPYKVEDGALVVFGLICQESQDAGYHVAYSIMDRDDIPF